MSSNIERQVMGNVAVIYGGRQLVSATALKLYVLAAGLWALIQLTWVHKVFYNWERVGPSHSFQFFSYAFLHTQVAVQATLAVIAVAGLWFIADVTRSLTQSHRSLSLLQ